MIIDNWEVPGFARPDRVHSELLSGDQLIKIKGFCAQENAFIGEDGLIYRLKEPTELYEKGYPNAKKLLLSKLKGYENVKPGN